MAIRLSTGLRNMLMGDGGVERRLLPASPQRRRAGALFRFRPANADAAETGANS